MRLGIAGIFCVWTQQGYSAVRHCTEDQESIDFSKSNSPTVRVGKTCTSVRVSLPQPAINTADALKSVRLAILVLQMLASVSGIISADQTKFQRP